MASGLLGGHYFGGPPLFIASSLDGFQSGISTDKGPLSGRPSERQGPLSAAWGAASSMARSQPRKMETDGPDTTTCGDASDFFNYHCSSVVHSGLLVSMVSSSNLGATTRKYCPLVRQTLYSPWGPARRAPYVQVNPHHGHQQETHKQKGAPQINTTRDPARPSILMVNMVFTAESISVVSFFPVCYCWTLKTLFHPSSCQVANPIKVDRPGVCPAANSCHRVSLAVGAKTSNGCQC